MTYVVTSDKAARTYNAGCKRLNDHMSGQGNAVQAYIEGLGEFETCINSVKRALRVFQLLVRNRGGLSVDRAVRSTAQRFGERITPLRNAIEHMDEQMDSLQDGEAHLLALREDGVFEIAGSTLEVPALCDVVTLLYEVGVSIIHSLPSLGEKAELNPRPQC